MTTEHAEEQPPGQSRQGAGPGAAAQRGMQQETTARSAQPASGPESVLVCKSCGRKNRIRPRASGVPSCGSCGDALPWHVHATDATFDAEAQAGVAVLVDLWAPWCGPCRFVGPILEELSREFAGRLKVVKVNVDENPTTAQRFQAFSIPTMVVLQGGRVVDRIVGAMPKGDLTVRLTPYLLRR